MINKTESIPRNLPSHIYFFLKCLNRNYADAFLKEGAMRFAYPSEWKPDGTSRGDDLEGVYASMKPFSSECDRFLKGMRKDVYRIKAKGTYFYKSNDVMSCRAYCVYGLNDNNMHLNDKRSQDHHFHQAGEVSKEYFHRLFPQWTKEEYQLLDNEEKPVVLMINPVVFYDRVKKTMLDLGVRENEILFKPVTYFDYFDKPFYTKKCIEELFTKHSDYEEQSEVRIVVKTRRKEVKELFDKNNGIIKLGPIDSSVATMSDLYFEDMLVEIRGNELLYSLATPKVENISAEMLILAIFQALADELPQAPMDIESIEEEISKYTNYLEKNFDAHYDPVTHDIEYNGVVYNFSNKSILCLMDHYYTYLKDNDLTHVKVTIDKIHHFFPKFQFEGGC